MNKDVESSDYPKGYSRELTDVILKRIAGGDYLKVICREPNMPAATEFHSWIIDDIDDLANRYARARAIGVELLFDEAMIVAKDGSNDEMLDEEGNTRVNHENIQRSKLIVDTIKFKIVKFAPKKYGEKLEVGGIPPAQQNFIALPVEDRIKQLTKEAGDK